VHFYDAVKVLKESLEMKNKQLTMKLLIEVIVISFLKGKHYYRAKRTGEVHFEDESNNGSFVTTIAEEDLFAEPSSTEPSHTYEESCVTKRCDSNFVNANYCENVVHLYFTLAKPQLNLLWFTQGNMILIYG